MTEQQLIEANIRLHNYLTGGEWKFDPIRGYNSVFDPWIRVANKGDSIENINYGNTSQFYQLWQVLQKIDKDEFVKKVTIGEFLNAQISQRYYNLAAIVMAKSNPIDIFWAINEFLIELNKCLEK